MNYPTVTLKAQTPERQSHPWVYDNEIVARPSPEEFTDGGMVRIKDAKGHVLGVGYANFHSKIAVRYLTRRYDEAVDAGFWRRRLQRALDYRRAHLGDAGTLPVAFRLAHGEADSLPGLVVDIYGHGMPNPYAVVQFLALGLEPWREAILAALTEIVPLTGVYERSDSHVRRLEGLEERVGVLWGDAPPDFLELSDQEAIVLADLKNGAKTGLFLDQRENQIVSARQARGRDVLNCFSYTGLFGLRAALAGATRVTDVEISPAFNAVSDQQWARSGLSVPHETVSANVFDHLRFLDGEKYRTDMVVLDPPAFTKNRASRDGAARGYHEINRVAMRLLRPDGVLVTCSCSHHFAASEFRDIVQAAAHDAGRSLRVIAQRGQPADHPVLMNAPESEYLKCLILAVA
jgi:23S rRNA (cytosine1962-C5)-methyltransferase